MPTISGLTTRGSACYRKVCSRGNGERKTVQAWKGQMGFHVPKLKGELIEGGKKKDQAQLYVRKPADYAIENSYESSARQGIAGRGERVEKVFIQPHRSRVPY